MHASLRRLLIVAAACLGAAVTAAAGQAQASSARELEEYFETREARISYSFAYRALLEGQVAGARSNDPYQLLAGNVDLLAAASAGGADGYDPSLGRSALLDTAEAVMRHPQTVTRGLGRALAGAGVARYLESYRVYRKWAEGKTITAAHRRVFRRGDDALQEVELGRTLIAETSGHDTAPASWQQRIAPLRQRLNDLRPALAEADAIEVLEAVRPLIDEACAALDDYAPYQRHRDELRNLLAYGTSEIGSTIARAHSRIMGPGATMQRTNFYRGPAVRELEGIQWKHDTVDPVRGQPAVSHNTIWFAAAGRFRWDPLRVYSLDLPTLEENWRFEAPARRGYSLTTYGSRLYLACGDVGAAPSYITCLEAATGEPRWVFEAPRGEENMLSHPAVDDGSVYVADRWGTLFCLDAQNGAERWTFESERGRRASAPTPALVDGVVFLPATHYVIAVEAATGEELMRLDASIGDGVLAVADDVLYFCDRGLAAYSLNEGRYLWAFQPADAEPFRGGPAVTANMVFARDTDTLYGVDRATGEKVWAFASPRPFDWKVSPVVAEDVVYIGTEGVQSATEGEGAYLYAIDAATGKPLWEVQVETSLYGSPPVIADGVVYFSSGRFLYSAR